MPEFGISGTECPSNSINCYPMDMTVLCHINGIIEINEVVSGHLPENSKSNESQKDINDQHLSLWAEGCFVKHSLLPSPAVKSSRNYC
jgi:hypothetical protein